MKKLMTLMAAAIILLSVTGFTLTAATQATTPALVVANANTDQQPAPLMAAAQNSMVSITADPNSMAADVTLKKKAQEVGANNGANPQAKMPQVTARSAPNPAQTAATGAHVVAATPFAPNIDAAQNVAAQAPKPANTTPVARSAPMTAVVTTRC